MPSILRSQPPLTWSKTRKPTTSWSSKPTSPDSSSASPGFPWTRRGLFPPPDITRDQGHGRHETREVYPFEITPENSGFPHAAQAAVVCRTTHHLKSVRVTEETEILLTSRPASRMSAAQIQLSRRGTWSIENPIHYVRDVTFGEDRSTVRTGHGPDNLATLRNLFIGICGLCLPRPHRR